MKRILIVLCLVSNTLTAQDSFSLVNYAPKFAFQTGKDCFAYAAAYMAFTTQEAYRVSVENPDSSFAFSFETINSLIRYVKGSTKHLDDTVAAYLYDGEGADQLGDLDYTLYVLYRYGTTRFRDHAGDRIDNTFFNSHTLFKSPKPIELFSHLNPIDAGSVLRAFKLNLRKGKPIIISVNQPEAGCKKWMLNKSIQARIKHIVTILGYNGNSFLVQNNYGGSNCRHYYTIQELLNTLEWAYVLGT